MGAVILKVGKRYKFREMEFWAQNGLIYMEDHRLTTDNHPDFLTKCTYVEFLKRAESFNLSLGRVKDPVERWHYDRLIEDAIACAREAKEQGNPCDPKVQAHHSRHRRRHWALPRSCSEGVMLRHVPANPTTIYMAS